MYTDYRYALIRKINQKNSYPLSLTQPQKSTITRFRQKAPLSCKPGQSHPQSCHRQTHQRNRLKPMRKVIRSASKKSSVTETPQKEGNTWWNGKASRHNERMGSTRLTQQGHAGILKRKPPFHQKRNKGA